MIKHRVIRTSLAVTALGLLASAAWAKTWTDWGAPVSAESLPGSSTQLNTTFVDGCPIQAPDGLSLYMASNRTGTLGGLDIWVAHRASKDVGWGTPVNLGAPINSAADDFCPTPVRGHRLFFVSKRTETNGDIYVSRKGPNGWQAPTRLGPNINSSSQEWSPSYFEDEDGHEVLYFSSTRPGGPGGHDIYYSVDFGPAFPAPGGVNTSADDARPNVSHNGREILFDSNRFGSLGATDIWMATRSSTSDQWGTAVQLANGINSAAGESRASFSWDGGTMVFGSTRATGEGATDIYVSKRTKITGSR